MNKLRSMLLNIRRNDAAGQVLAQLIAGIMMISMVFLVIGVILCPGTGKLFFAAGLIVGAVAAVFAVIGAQCKVRVFRALHIAQRVRQLRILFR